VELAYEKLGPSSLSGDLKKMILKNEAGEEMEDDEAESEDMLWIENMLLKAEITSIERCAE